MFASNCGRLVLDGLWDLESFILFYNLILIPTQQREAEVKFLSQGVLYAFCWWKAVCTGFISNYNLLLKCFWH